MAEVVVGVDGTEGSARAVRVALQEAAVLGDALRVVHVFATTPYVGAVPGYGYDLPPVSTLGGEVWAKELVEEAVREARAGAPVPGVSIVADAEPGDAGTELVRASTLADLLVVGARRHGTLASVVIGSASNHVLHHAQCPVLVVPSGPGPVRPWHRVVVGVDGSDCGDAALRWAAARASAHGCPLLVVHTWQLVTNPDWFGEVPIDVSQYGEQIEDWLQVHVREVLGDRPDLPVEVRAVRDDTAAGLLSSAGPDDLLVIGSRGRGGFASLVLGSVALQCAHHARSAVAVLRSGTGPTP